MCCDGICTTEDDGEDGTASTQRKVVVESNNGAHRRGGERRRREDNAGQREYRHTRSAEQEVTGRSHKDSQVALIGGATKSGLAWLPGCPTHYDHCGRYPRYPTLRVPERGTRQGCLQSSVRGTWHERRRGQCRVGVECFRFFFFSFFLLLCSFPL